MDIVFDSADRKILKVLLLNGQEEVYYFHENFMFSPAQIIQSVAKLLELDIVEVEDYKINLTDYGLRWVLANRLKVFCRVKDMFWKQVPDEMMENKIMVNEPYMPRRKSIDLKFFKKVVP